MTEAEAPAYDKAVAAGISLNNVPELQDAFQRAYEEIEEMEIENGVDMECQGLAPMDQDELNDLVADRDPHALAFLGLTGATDDELDEWDAYDLDEVPAIKEFQEDFEPYSPYDEGWTLNVQFVETSEY